MSNPRTSEKSVYLDREEHVSKGAIAAKRVVTYRYDSATDTLLPGTELKYQIKNISPPNDPEIATYKYFGFQEEGGTSWKIMRKTLATNIFLYATGTSAYSTAWTNKDSQSYS